MNTIEVMKQTLAYLENGHFTYETKIADDLRAAIKREEANIQTQITKDILRPVKTYSGGKAWPVQTEWVGLMNEEIDDLDYLVSATGYCSDDLSVEGVQAFARAIEAKLKEKNSKG
jgi:cation diffusion facilitator CzcD-associated flavoprotein CzcO